MAFWTLYFKGNGGKSDHPFLNKRSAKFVGDTYTLDEPIVNGKGRMKVGESWWRVEGPDLPAQTRVKVIAASGVVLKVEPLDAVA